MNATDLAQLVQITSCMLDALKKTAPEFSHRARYLDSARFLLVMAFDPSIDNDLEGK